MPRIEPNLELKRFGLGDGWLTLTPDGVSITVSPDPKRARLPIGHADTDEDVECTMMVAPEFAPLLRMVARRLDEIAGVRKPRPRQ